MFKNILLLSLSQAFMLSATALTMSSSAMVGLEIAPSVNLSTLPLSLSYLAVLFMLIPSSLIMQKIGRRAGFMMGAISAILSGLIAGFSIYHNSFWWFCVSAVFMGIAMSTAQFYRFAAIEVSSFDYRSRAISLVLAGGIAAAFLGPGIARFTQYTFAGPAFSASFASIAILGLGVFLCQLFIRIPKTEEETVESEKRPLRSIIIVPSFIVAVFGAATAYASMNLLMISTPLAMHGHGHAFGATSSVIQWHIIGMFAPSFFTGNLIHRFGVLKIMLAGVLLFFVCVFINLSGNSYLYFVSALVFLGVGWNFLFVGGTTLLTEVYFPREKSLVQGMNEFIVFLSVAISSLSSGFLYNTFGWVQLNLLTVPVLVLATIGVLWLMLLRSREGVANNS